MATTKKHATKRGGAAKHSTTAKKAKPKKPRRK
jgi:hypothetical protein